MQDDFQMYSNKTFANVLTNLVNDSGYYSETEISKTSLYRIVNTNNWIINTKTGSYEPVLLLLALAFGKVTLIYSSDTTL